MSDTLNSIVLNARDSGIQLVINTWTTAEEIQHREEYKWKRCGFTISDQFA